MSFVTKIIAYTVPAVCIVLGFTMLITGYSGGPPSLVMPGWIFFATGVILQILWLFMRIKR